MKGQGHTKMKRPIARLVTTATAAVVASLAMPCSSRAELPPDFQRTTILSDLDDPTVITFTPDGRLLIGQRKGAILLVDTDDEPAADPVIDIPTNTAAGERGLVGLTVDPNFDSNGWLYVYYTTTEPRNRVSRFTIIGDSASLDSEFVVWENPDLAATWHHGGAIGFGPDGKLYIATGEQHNPPLAQDLSNHHGKILRLQADGAIPKDNPFVDTPGAEPHIWAYGLRNPYRFSFDQVTGDMWIGNVGGNLITSWEEIERGEAGANYGWPEQEGPDCFVGDCAQYNVAEFFYQHSDPMWNLDQPQGCLTMGQVYRSGGFPESYQGSLFIGDYANRWIRRLLLDENGAITGWAPFDTEPDAGTIVDLKFSPLGALYYVTYGLPWTGPPDISAVHRIEYIGVTVFGDLDGDGVVGTTDLLMLLGMWGVCQDCDACAADLDGDCIVGTIDLLMLLGAWRG